MPKPSYAQIAAHLGVSKAMVVKLTKKGMPTTSLKAAANWRKRQQMKREPTGGLTASLREKPKGRPKKLPKSASTGAGLQDTLTNITAVERTAFEAYQEAAAERSRTTSARLSEYNKASQNRLQAERAYREELERRGLLVLRSDITERCKRSLETVIRRLKRLPGEQGPQCNEKEPLKAAKILQRAVDEILMAGQQALHDFESQS